MLNVSAIGHAGPARRARLSVDFDSNQGEAVREETELPPVERRGLVVYMMRLANSGARVNGNDIGHELRRLAQEMNEALPPGARLALDEDPACVARFEGADASDLEYMALLAFGSYRMDPAQEPLIQQRVDGFMALEPVFRLGENHV